MDEAEVEEDVVEVEGRSSITIVEDQDSTRETT